MNYHKSRKNKYMVGLHELSQKPRVRLYMMGQHELSQKPRVRLRGGTTLDTITYPSVRVCSAPLEHKRTEGYRRYRI